MRKNNPAKFHPDPIWNDGVLGFFEERRSNNNKNKMSVCGPQYKHSTLDTV